MQINENISRQILVSIYALFFVGEKPSERDKGSFYCYPTYLNYPDKNKQEERCQNMVGLF